MGTLTNAVVVDARVAVVSWTDISSSWSVFGFRFVFGFVFGFGSFRARFRAGALPGSMAAAPRFREGLTGENAGGTGGTGCTGGGCCTSGRIDPVSSGGSVTNVVCGTGPDSGSGTVGCGSIGAGIGAITGRVRFTIVLRFASMLTFDVNLTG